MRKSENQRLDRCRSYTALRHSARVC